jgi:hypothetical protein
MEFITGSNLDVFGPEVQVYLEKEEALNNLLLGIIRHVQHSEPLPEHKPCFLKVVDGVQILLVGVMTPPQKLVLYSDTLPEPAIFSELAVYLKADGWRIPGVLGPTPLSTYFADAWSAQTGLSKEPGVRQRTFWLRQVVNHSKALGCLRLASTTDLDLLSEWMYGFHCEVWADTVPQDLVLQRGVVEKLIGQKALYIWQDRQPVSMAAQTRASTNGIAINAV